MARIPPCLLVPSLLQAIVRDGCLVCDSYDAPPELADTFSRGKVGRIWVAGDFDGWHPMMLLPSLLKRLSPPGHRVSIFRRVTLTWAPRRLQRGPTPGGVRSRLGWSAAGPAASKSQFPKISLPKLPHLPHMLLYIHVQMPGPSLPVVRRVPDTTRQKDKFV
jgi:hypothetical protein